MKFETERGGGVEGGGEGGVQGGASRAIRAGLRSRQARSGVNEVQRLGSLQAISLDARYASLSFVDEATWTLRRVAYLPNWR